MSKEPLAPSFIHQIDLVSAESSKIDKVSLYVGRAELTRSFKIDVKTGQNQVKISELPTVLDKDSLRVEGRGLATILGVTVSDKYTTVALSQSLQSLEDRREITQKAIARCTKAIASIEAYLGTLDAKSLGSEHLGPLLDAYEAQAEKLDLKLLKLQADLKELHNLISQEHALWAAERRRRGLVSKMATIDIFVETEGKVELVLIYAVAEASWSAVYDIRADMSGDNNPLTLVYKAAIKQSTGESWDDVSLTLETVTPTFSAALPRLDPWRVGVYKPPLTSKTSMQAPDASYFQSTGMSGDNIGGASMRLETERERSRSGGPVSWSHTDTSITHRETVVANQGNLNASFQVPGFITVPSDNEVHTVTVVELQLEATMAWIGIPRAVPKVHIKAKIKNASNFPLLNGTASVYVDGSFVSKTTVPEVSPQESFDCSLGVDPSIRLTYHPLSKNSSENGFYNKSSSHTYSQHITVHNTKNITIRDLTIIDHIPLSEDSQVTIKLINPALPPPPAASTAMSSMKIVVKSEKAPAPLKVGENVVAHWDGGDDPQDDVSTIGREGRIAWKCVLTPQSKVNIALVWEVSAPANITITGL